jgi:hypothetical protein
MTISPLASCIFGEWTAAKPLLLLRMALEVAAPHTLPPSSRLPLALRRHLCTHWTPHRGHAPRERSAERLAEMHIPMNDAIIYRWLSETRPLAGHLDKTNASAEAYA